MDLIGVLRWVETGEDYRIFLKGSDVYIKHSFHPKYLQLVSKESFFHDKSFYMNKFSWLWFPEEPFEGNV